MLLVSGPASLTPSQIANQQFSAPFIPVSMASAQKNQTLLGRHKGPLLKATMFLLRGGGGVGGWWWWCLVAPLEEVTRESFSLKVTLPLALFSCFLI